MGEMSLAREKLKTEWHSEKDTEIDVMTPFILNSCLLFKLFDLEYVT